MPDLWGSGPSLPPPNSPEPSTLDRPALGAQSRSGDSDVQHIDGATYRTDAIGEGETPFPFEQVERHLDGKLAGVYGTDAVPDVRQALRDAVAIEGLGAYERFRSDPGAFGEVRGDATGADGLGRELREVEVYRVYSTERGHLVAVDPAADRTLTRTPEPGWLTTRDAEIAHETREALSDRRADVVREVERRSGDRRAEAEQLLQSVDRSIETIDLIGARQDFAFTFRTAQSSSDGGSTGVLPDRGSDGRPVIRIVIAGERGSSESGNRVHELYHAGEYARGRVSVRVNPEGKLEGAAADFYSGNEEVAAYRAQYAFDRESLKPSPYSNNSSNRYLDRVPRNLGEVNREYVEGLRGADDRRFYTGLQWAP